jgi:hypothetical protein
MKKRRHFKHTEQLKDRSGRSRISAELAELMPPGPEKADNQAKAPKPRPRRTSTAGSAGELPSPE